MSDEEAVELGARVALAAVEAFEAGAQPEGGEAEESRLRGYREMARSLLLNRMIVVCPSLIGAAADVAIASAKAAMSGRGLTWLD